MLCVHCHKEFEGAYCSDCWDRLAFGTHDGTKQLNDMAKKELAIRLLVDEKEVNKALVMLDQDALSPEELDKRFFSREALLFDVETLGEDTFPIVAAFTAIIEDDNQSKENK